MAKSKSKSKSKQMESNHNDVKSVVEQRISPEDLEAIKTSVMPLLENPLRVEIGSGDNVQVLTSHEQAIGYLRHLLEESKQRMKYARKLGGLLPIQERRERTKKILSVMTSLREAEKPWRKAVEEDSNAKSEALRNLEKWLESKSVLNREQLGFGGVDDLKKNENGTFTKSHIKKGDTIMTVPRDIMLTTDMYDGMPDSPFEALENDPVANGIQSTKLVLTLMYESLKEDSPLSPYFTTLPDSFSIPVYCSVDDLQIIEGSSVELRVLNTIEVTAYHYTHFFLLMSYLGDKAPIPAGQFYLNHYMWATGVVLTRQNPIPSRQSLEEAMKGSTGESDQSKPVENDKQCELALIPGWDMCNHEIPNAEGQQLSEEAITTAFDSNSNKLIFLAGHDMDVDSEVRMFYGPRSNDNLMLYSGFVLDENPFDTLELDMHWDAKEDPLLKMKLNLLRQSSCDLETRDGKEFKFPICIAANGRFNHKRYIMHAAVMCMDKACMEETLRSNVDNDEESKVVSPVARQAAYKMIADQVSEFLKREPVSEEVVSTPSGLVLLKGVKNELKIAKRLEELLRSQLK